MLIDIDCINQSMKIDTHNFLRKINQFLLILLIDEKLLKLHT